MAVDESAPLLPRSRADIEKINDHNANGDNVPLGSVAGKNILAYYRGLLLAWSSVCRTLRVLRGKDKRLQKHTVQELRGITATSALAVVSTLFQIWILPLFHLDDYIEFSISVGVSEIINSIVEWCVGRHVRAFGAALTNHIVEYVFIEVGKKTDRERRERCLGLVKESLRKSDGLGNFLFALNKAFQVSISVFIGVAFALWPRIGFWLIPVSLATTVFFVGGLAFTQWSLSWKNAEKVNEHRAILNQKMSAAHATLFPPCSDRWIKYVLTSAQYSTTCAAS